MRRISFHICFFLYFISSSETLSYQILTLCDEFVPADPPEYFFDRSSSYFPCYLSFIIFPRAISIHYNFHPMFFYILFCFKTIFFFSPFYWNMNENDQRSTSPSLFFSALTTFHGMAIQCSHKIGNLPILAALGCTATIWQRVKLRLHLRSIQKKILACNSFYYFSNIEIKNAEQWKAHPTSKWNSLNQYL